MIYEINDYKVYFSPVENPRPPRRPDVQSCINQHKKRKVLASLLIQESKETSFTSFKMILKYKYIFVNLK